MILLPSFMSSLALVLGGTYATGSARAGGLMVTAYVMCLTFFAPLAGRLIDRLGLRTGAPLLLIFATVLLGILAMAVALRASAPLLLILSGTAGAFIAGLAPAVDDWPGQRKQRPSFGLMALLVNVACGRVDPRLGY
jgi:MFS family permease